SRCHWNSGWRIWSTARPADSGAISARSSRASGERRAEVTRRAPSKLHETMIGDAGERLDVLARVADDDAIQLHPGMRLQSARRHLDADREPAARDATTTEHPLNRQRAHQTLRPEDPVHGGTRDGPAYFLDVLKAHRLLLRRSRLEVQQPRNRRSPGPNLTGDQVALRLQQQPDVTRRKCPDAPTPDRQRFHGPQCPAIRSSSSIPKEYVLGDPARQMQRRPDPTAKASRSQAVSADPRAAPERPVAPLQLQSVP